MLKQFGWLTLMGWMLATASGCYCCVTGPHINVPHWQDWFSAKNVGPEAVVAPGCDGPAGHCDACGGAAAPHTGCKWCGNGCGETYYHEWYNDPPDCHQPCDHCGNWTGPGVVRVPHAYGHAVENSCADCGE